MKQAVAFCLIPLLALFFFSQCSGLPVRVGYDWPGPDIPKHNSNPGVAVLLIVFGSLIVIPILIKVIPKLRINLQSLLYTPSPSLSEAGKNIQTLFHEEAPAEAEFIGDVESGNMLNIAMVKTDLCNKAALLGGDILLVDDILTVRQTSESFQYFKGHGRVYKKRI